MRRLRAAAGYPYRLARGRAARLRWRVRSALGGTTVVGGRGLRLRAPLIISGPGTVVLGDRILVDRATVLYTRDAGAVIEIGDRTYLNGVRVTASVRVTIGPECLIGDGRIMDTDYHHLDRRRNRMGPPPGEPVTIGRNVWVGTGAGILKGVSVGDNSVVGFGAVVRSDVAPDRVVAGNPAVDVGAVP